jgi:hypothetical protein
LGGIKGNDKLAGGVNRVGGKAERNAMETMPGRERWVGFIRAKSVECELSLGEEIRPAVVRERDVDRRQDRDEVILGGTNGSFRREGSVVEGKDVFVGEVGRLEESG